MEQRRQGHLQHVVDRQVDEEDGARAGVEDLSEKNHKDQRQTVSLRSDQRRREQLQRVWRASDPDLPPDSYLGTPGASWRGGAASADVGGDAGGAVGVGEVHVPGGR